MAIFMIWYRTAQGKLTTVKIPAATKTEAIKKFKKSVRDTKPFRVLKLKSKSTRTAPKKRRKKRTSSKMGKCSRKPESTDPTSEMFGRRRKKRRKLSGENHKDVFIHGRKKKRKSRRKSRRMAGYKKSTGRDLILIPGDKSKADLQKDKLKNNIIIYGRNKKHKGGRKMPKLKGDIVKILIAGMTGAAGGIAGTAAGKFIPIPEQFKPFLPIALGIAVNYAPLKPEMKNALSIGLITIGTIAALKKFMPQLTFLEGQDEITQSDLDLLGLSDNSDPAQEQDDIFGEVVDVSGEVITMGDDWITPNDN